MTNMNFIKPRLNIKLTPWQVTGLTDGEGSFAYSIYRVSDKTGLTKYKISLEFKVTPPGSATASLKPLA